MARMKSRQVFPPGGWEYLQPQTGWSVPRDSGFEEAVRALMAHRRANAWVTQQNKLSTDYNTVANEVDEYNAAKCLAHPGWEHFVGNPEPPKSWTPSAFSLRRRVEGVAGANHIRRTAAGIRLVADWVGTGLKPVEKEVAERRGGVCVTCPNNTNPNWIQKLDAALAAEIKTLVEIKNDLKLSTIHDKNLLSCSLCDCYMPLKVWAPIEHIWANSPQSVKDDLSKVVTSDKHRCWVVQEAEQLKTNNV